LRISNQKLKEFKISKKILIFGGTGAIGFSVAKNLKDDGYNPIIFTRNEEGLIN